MIRGDVADGGRGGPLRRALSTAYYQHRPKIARQAAHKTLTAIVDFHRLLPTPDGSSEWRPIRRSGFESSSRHHVFVLALTESPPFNYQPQLGPGVKPLLKGFASERYSGHQLTDHAPPMSSGIPTPNEIFGSAPASRKIQAGLKPLIVIPD